MGWDLGMIIAILGSSICIVGVVISMMYWVRSESNELRKEAKEDRRDMVNLIKAIELEMKDFHYKLLEIQRGK